MSTEAKTLNTETDATHMRPWHSNWRDYVVYIGFVVIFIVFAILLQDRGFLSSNNLLNILRQTAIVAIVSMAMSFVLSAGEIDLSVGAIAGLSSVVAGLVLSKYGLFPGILAGLTLGLLVGAINGGLTAYLNIPSIIAAAWARLGCSPVIRAMPWRKMISPSSHSS